MSLEEKKFAFRDGVKKSLKEYLGTDDADLEEALNEILGDTFFELRKLEAIVAKSVERAIIDKRYTGYFEGKALTEEDIERLKMRQIVKEDLKDELKEAVEECWNTVLKKQKVGVDKFFIRLTKIIKK